MATKSILVNSIKGILQEIAAEFVKITEQRNRCLHLIMDIAVVQMTPMMQQIVREVVQGKASDI